MSKYEFLVVSFYFFFVCVSVVGRQFCGSCLKNRYGEDIQEKLQDSVRKPASNYSLHYLYFFPVDVGVSTLSW